MTDLTTATRRVLDDAPHEPFALRIGRPGSGYSGAPSRTLWRASRPSYRRTTLSTDHGGRCGVRWEATMVVDVRRRVHQSAWTRGRVAHDWERSS